MSDSEQVQYPDTLANAAHNLPTVERAQEMIDIDLKYGSCFFNSDFDGMRECLVDSPEFEMHPLGIRISGMEAVIERSKRVQAGLLAPVDPRSNKPVVVRTACFSKDAMMVEWNAELAFPDGTIRKCYAVAVIPYDGDKIVGERVYTCENFAELRKQALGADFSDVEGVTRL